METQSLRGTKSAEIKYYIFNANIFIHIAGPNVIKQKCYRFYAASDEKALAIFLK